MTGPDTDGTAEPALATSSLLVAACRAFSAGESLTSEPPPAWQGHARASGLLPVVTAVLPRSTDPAMHAARFGGAETHLRTGPDRRWLTRELTDAGFAWVFLKGPVLACLAYRRPYLRPYGDLDVLVHPDELPAVVPHLLGRGCELLDRNWVAVADGRRGQISLRLPHGQVLDLHWHLVNQPAARDSFRLSSRDVLARRSWHDIGGEHIPSLEPLDVAVHVAVHACLSGCHELRWLLDVDQAVQWAASGPQQLVERSRELGVELPVAVTLDRVHAVLGSCGDDADAFARTPWRSLVMSRLRARPPAPAPGRRHPEVAFYSSTRATSAASAAATARHYAGRLRPASTDLYSRPPERVAARARDRWLTQAAGTR